MRNWTYTNKPGTNLALTANSNLTVEAKKDNPHHDEVSLIKEKRRLKSQILRRPTLGEIKFVKFICQRSVNSRTVTRGNVHWKTLLIYKYIENQRRVTHLGSTNDEKSAGIYVEDGLFVEIPRWNNILDYFVHNCRAKIVEGNFFAVLQRHDYCVNANRNASTLLHYILAGDLELYKKNRGLKKIVKISLKI